MSNWQTFGHDRVTRILDRQLESGIFSHAYLFVGPEFIGKKSLAQEFAQRIMGVGNLSAHPDFVFHDARAENGVESMRAFTERLSSKPFLGNKTVAIVDNVDGLTKESSNALLKTLEEPNSSVIILLVGKQAGLLPTIISRCQVFACTQTSRKELESYIALKKLSVPQAVVHISGGAIGKLSRLMESKDDCDTLQKRVELLNTASGASQFEKLTAAQELAELETEDLEQALTSWLHYLKATGFSFPEAQRILEALSQLQSYVNKKHVAAHAIGAYHS